jgi:hypothetical protein
MLINHPDPDFVGIIPPLRKKGNCFKILQVALHNYLR